MGNVFTDELTLKEGDLLSVLSFGDYYTDQAYKEELNSWIQQGYQLIVPSRLLTYKKWKDIGFIARDPNKGSAAMIIYSSLNGGATVTDPSLWREDDKKIFIDDCIIVSLIPEILAPDENSVYYRGDSINVTIRYEIVYDCGDGPQQPKIITKNYTYLSTAQHEPDKHFLCVEGFTAGGERVVDTRPIWVIEFEIDEDNVTKYFNPYKPDSARIKYSLKPDNYANPDIDPKPISMEVEIKDKDENVVCELRDLTLDEQRNQLLWWDGVDDFDNMVDINNSPFTVKLKLKYKTNPDKEKEVSTDVVTIYLEITEIQFPNEENSFLYAPDDFPEEDDFSCKAEIEPGSFLSLLYGLLYRDRILWEVSDNPEDEINSGDPDDPGPEDEVEFEINNVPEATNGRGSPLSYKIKAKYKIQGTEIESRDTIITQDEIDQCRQEYVDMDTDENPIRHKPTRDEFVNEDTYENPGHFSFDEINSGDFSCAIFNVAQNLESVRTTLGTGMTVTSGYRNPIHNANIGGATNSQHMYGYAVDIAVGDYDGDGEPNDRDDWRVLRQAAWDNGACVEPAGYGGRDPNYTYVHMDWRQGSCAEEWSP